MRVVVVGGGSSGWLVASGLIRYLPNYEISVVESPNIPTIGVGESTTAYVKHFIKHCLKIDEYDFLKKTNGIYKMSVKFQNFSKNNEEGYHYPFGQPNVQNFDNLYITAWDMIKNFDKNVKHEDFAKFLYPAYSLFTKNKIDENKNNEFDNFDFDTDLGYHFDANKVGEYLREFYCKPKGVKHIVDNVKDVSFLNDEVDFLLLESGEKVFADIFVDCTGFKSILLGKRMQPKFIDVSNKLLNDSAWATPTQYDNVYSQMQPYTTATALNNGWAWYTPISSRIGNGYSYSQKFVDSESALNEFKDYLLASSNHKMTKDEINDLPFFEVKMRTGFYEKSMIKNVVGIGLSSGFLEPLEGTGLHFVIEQLYSFIKIIENGKPNQFLIDSFNLRTKDLYETWIDTLSIIYLSSRKDNSEYWKHINNMEVVNLNLKEQNHFHDLSHYSYRLHSWNRHNYENDLFNNIIRGSGLINNYNQMDSDIYLMYNKNFDNKYKEILDAMHKNLKKWEKNSENSLHIYTFLLKNNAINV